MFYDFDLLRRETTLAQPPSASLRALTFVVFDTETTGLLPDRGDAIVQIGAVRIVNGRLIEHDVFDRLVDPGRAIPARAARIHGITDAMVAGAPSIGATLSEFRAFVADAVLVAQNAAFDMAFLRCATGTGDAGLDNPVLDTMLLSIHLDGAAGDHSLDAIAARLGVEVGGRHTALARRGRRRRCSSSSSICCKRAASRPSAPRSMRRDARAGPRAANNQKTCPVNSPWTRSRRDSIARSASTRRRRSSRRRPPTAT